MATVRRNHVGHVRVVFDFQPLDYVNQFRRRWHVVDV